MITYGKGGWTYNDLYNMPIFLRTFYFKELVKALEKENDAATAPPPSTTRSIPLAVQKHLNTKQK